MALAVKSCPPQPKVGLRELPPLDHVENSSDRRKSQPETGFSSKVCGRTSRIQLSLGGAPVVLA